MTEQVFSSLLEGPNMATKQLAHWTSPAAWYGSPVPLRGPATAVRVSVCSWWAPFIKLNFIHFYLLYKTSLVLIPAQDPLRSSPVRLPFWINHSPDTPWNLIKIAQVPESYHHLRLASKANASWANTDLERDVIVDDNHKIVNFRNGKAVRAVDAIGLGKNWISKNYTQMLLLGRPHFIEHSISILCSRLALIESVIFVQLAHRLMSLG